MGIIMGSPLRGIARLRDCRSKRISSYDKTGGNHDFITIGPKEKRTIADIRGAGCITHIWMTIASNETDYLRKIVLRMFWDGEQDASVKAPIGDFFGVGHGKTHNFVSLPFTMSPQNGKAMNCFLPMPFKSGARIEIENEGEGKIDKFYFYIDYEVYEELDDTWGRFHCFFNRENPCDGISEEGLSNEEFQFGGKNLSGEGNYLILHAEGKGHYIGCNLNIHNLRKTDQWNWYGEGDDMIFVDGEPFPPSLHGTGTEDYFNMAWCPYQEFNAPYHGLILPGGDNWSGKISLYRFHIEDPICFSKSIRVTIEHGHNNHRSDDYSSTAYWYQQEPHKPFKLIELEKRIPRKSFSYYD